MGSPAEDRESKNITKSEKEVLINFLFNGTFSKLYGI